MNFEQLTQLAERISEQKKKQPCGIKINPNYYEMLKLTGLVKVQQTSQKSATLISYSQFTSIQVELTDEVETYEFVYPKDEHEPR